MKTILMLLIMLAGTASHAQITKASLQASGLTCSMCSKAVKEALEKVSFVEKIQVDIKNQQYNLTFKNNEKAELDLLSKAVEDAGFSVASLKVTVDVKDIKANKDAHVSIGDKYFHFLNASGQKLDGSVVFTVVDKQFLSAKEFKKYSAASKMSCVQTGKAAACCTKENIAPSSRIYHVII